jgi:deoxycytidylate deaminase
MRDSYYLAQAKKASKKSNHHRHQLGCVIAKGSEILGVGYNVLKTHPKSPNPFHQIHAEFMAYINADCNVAGATAYVYRQLKNGFQAAAKPCPTCWKFLMDCGIKQVVYSYEGSFKQEKMK